MAARNHTVIDPIEDPRLPGSDIPTYLFKACQRWSDESPSSPSLKGFRASTSGLKPTDDNRDAFPASLLHLEVFFDNYCGIMDNPLTYKTNTHAHFVGLYSSRTFAEREAELLRKGSTTEYRVYCVRGAELRDMGVSVIRGRAIVTIGRENDRHVVHTNPALGEEYLVWGRVPVEAVLGSWGVDGVMQFARGNSHLALRMSADLMYGTVRQAARLLRGPSQRVDYIHKFLPGPEVSAEEALAFANSLSHQSQARGFASSSRPSNSRPQLTGPPPPPLTATRPPTALGRPPRRQTRIIPPQSPFRPPQASQPVAFASPPPAPHPPYHLPGLMAIAPPPSRQRPYQSPYGGTASNPSFNPQALRPSASATQPAPRSLNNPDQLRIALSPPEQQHRPYASPYGGPGHMDGPEDVTASELEIRQKSEVDTEGNSDDYAEG
ncbi:hypothetical protein DL98DRAFT_654270 [Cadophora sp. DSE1049]|nr:hypothetical protein DL98DRAFT_654270 [Cadophora sp. DSE1049]